MLSFRAFLARGPLTEVLAQVHGRWALVSKDSHRVLAYYKGSGKPSEEWVKRQERRIQYFKHH